MELEEKIKKDIEETNKFLSKKLKDISYYKNLLNKNIDTIPDEKTKAKISKMMAEAMNGNIKNVQAIAKQLQNDLEIKNKENE